MAPKVIGCKNMLKYIKQLIDKHDSASTHTLLTILTVVILLCGVVGVIAAMWWKPMPGVLVALLATISTLTGIQSVKENFDSKPNNKDT